MFVACGTPHPTGDKHTISTLLIKPICSCIKAEVVVFGQSGCIRAKMVVFGNFWFYSGKSGCIRVKWLYSGRGG